MTQKEIVEWAISGIKIKRIALNNGYQENKITNPDTAMRISYELTDLNKKQEELEMMLEGQE